MHSTVGGLRRFVERPNRSSGVQRLIEGVAMSITAFPVLARILAEHTLLSTRLGTIAISCAAVDDVTAWCLLAFVVAVVKSGTLLSAVIRRMYRPEHVTETQPADADSGLLT